MRRAALTLAWAAGLCLSLSVPAAAMAAGTPQLGSAWTAGVGTASAGLRAEVGPNGLLTTYRFDYLPEASYRANLAEGKDGFSGAAKAPAGADPALGSGTASVTVAQATSSLLVDTAYRYRVQASNAAGTVAGPSRVFFTEAFATGATMLDERAWELVSPADKGGGALAGFGQSFGGGVLQAPADGDAMTFSSTFAFGGDAPGAPAASQYLARRTATGWASENITEPSTAGAYGSAPDGVPYQLFSAGLERGLLLNGRPCAVDEACLADYSLRESGGGIFSTSPAAPGLRFAGATPDLSQVVLSTCAALTSAATEAPLGDGCDPAEPNLYRWSAIGLELVNIAPGATQGTPGASLAAQAGAVSADGARAYWTAGGDLYLREAGQSEQVDASVGGGGTFQAASADGSLAFFAKDGHLYRYDATAATAVDLTPGGEVLGVLGASADGSRLYYATPAGVFLWQGGSTTTVAAGAVAASSYPPTTGSARVTPDGTHLAFVSTDSLTGYDNRDVVSGVPVSEVFLYDAGAGTLICASCDPNGERPLGGSTIPGAVANGRSALAARLYKPRSLSADGRRLFFDSADLLALQDTGKQADVYEWEAFGSGTCQRQGGCVALISRGRNSEGASFVDASVDGSDVFFLTEDSLVGADAGFADLYDAREGGGFAEPVRPIECAGDACQFLPSEPEDPTPGTLVPSPGNPPLRFAATRSSRCRKGLVRKRGRCVKRPGHRRSHRGRR
jgi:hypothetical protein